ncbi:CARDB domain-containing protein [Thermococcus sp.]|uniref:CARDB domain-containing protein n=1 Tax=Thermococcus sp. TaxID=35749 RepID=UPI0026207DB3|nr:CARDB domain-containing protein [Thermococcus sp.]
MKKAVATFLALVLLLSLLPATKFASAREGSKIIDGNLNDWTPSDLVAIGRDNGQAGANLGKLYVAWDDQYLYIAVETNNTASWDVAYGFGIDVDPGAGTGYNGTSDAWGRKVGFTSGFGLEYELYFWWSGSSGMGTDNFITWTGSGWDYKSLADVGAKFAYTGDTSTGLKTLEIAIPWSAIGGMPKKVAVMSWITGSGGSAVDSLPVGPAINYSDIGSEWGDTDVFSNMAVVAVGPKTIDGNLSDWSGTELVAEDVNGTGVPGGNLTKFYVSWDKNYLYLAIETNNTANWGMAYGFGIDVDPGTGNGYTSGGDAWGRSIEFGNGFAVDYEVYFWWDDSSASITAAQLNTYNGGWDYPSLESKGGKYAYTGDSSRGLKTLEVAIPWSAIGGKPKSFAVSAWITGGSGSAVDVLPQESVARDSGDEWSDTDVITEMSTLSIFIPAPELVPLLEGPTVVGLNRVAHYTLTVKNLGSLTAENFSVVVYVDNTTFGEWNLTLGPSEEKVIPFNLTFSQLGDHEIRAVVDPDNRISEVDETNNVAVLNVQVIWVGKVDVDGSPDDWPKWTLKDNTFLVQNGYFIWKDAMNDQRHDKDPYLPGRSSAHADLTEVGVSKDDKYVYFLFEFQNMSNIKIGQNGATLIAVPIDFKKGGSNEFAAELDTLTAISWDLQFVVNLGGDEHKGETSVVVTPGTSVKSLFYILMPDGSMITPEGALMGVDLSKNTVEVRLPLSLFEGHTEFKFQVATGFSYGPAVWNFGNDFANDNIPDVVDTVSPGPTLNAFTNNVLDYYVEIKMNNVVESAKVTTIEEERRQLARDTFFAIAKYYSPKRFEQNYKTYLRLMQEIEKYKPSGSTAEELEKINSEVEKLRLRYELGMKYLEQYGTLTGAIRIYSANLDLSRIIRRLQSILKALQSGELEKKKHMEELAKKLTKNIDGNLDDWNVQPVAVDEKNFGQDGADLKALYVDYDDNFLYIALTTNNKASWRIAYGIALDYKDGGYTTGQDSWGKKMSFTRGIDAELYFFWNGEFFGSPGTDNITTAQIAIWNGEGWDYEDLKWVGFYAYTGGSNGLQTLEIAIPWSALGGKPAEVSLVAYITGQGVGDSAVDALPDQPAIHDKDPGQEWTDADEFTNFVTVSIS